MKTSLACRLGVPVFALAFGCERPTEERALRDRSVGHATSSAFDVHVAAGLAAVRSLSAGELHLWQSAPSIELELVVRQAMTLHLEVENSMPEAELTELATQATLPLASGEDSTQKSWTLELAEGTVRFRLATPDAQLKRPFTFALMSDVQEAIDDVQDIYQLVNREDDVEFLLGAGDLTSDGEDEELSEFQAELKGLAVPYYTTLGNHELLTDPCQYQDWFGRTSFQFSHHGVYFTLLDSASASLDPIVYDELKGWLKNGRDAVHIVGMHIPPFDPFGSRNAAFANREEASALVGRLAEMGVDLTLYGHIHSYYSYRNAGIPAFISGGGGAIPERLDGIGRHFMVFELSAARGVTSSRVVRVDD